MFLRLASNFIRQPIMMKQISKQLTFLPMTTILNNHKLLIYNLSQLHTAFFQIEEQNDDDDLLLEEVPVRRTNSNQLN
ncbi:unnamed protein product [Paramecium primaurelia]|uniref:Uncharacterized protein n=2 Tax=Paramecium TaxID=5884 RepID=A0A8S1VG59_9CILI|nr:unnamed protein product [Paramecium primaurelia]CAD8175413.1 unnamed protein product [Paramecium pentaurelia]